MGEEGEEKCLSQHKSLPRHFQGSSCHPQCDSRQRLRDQRGPRPSPARAVRASNGTSDHALTRTPPTDAVSGVLLSDTSGTHFLGGPWRGALAFLGSCSAWDGSGDSWPRFSKSSTTGTPPTSSAASRTQTFLCSTKKHPPLSLAAFVTMTVFYDCRFL